MMYLPVQVHVRIPFYFPRNKMQCYLLRVFVQWLVANSYPPYQPLQKTCHHCCRSNRWRDLNTCSSQSAMHRGERVRVHLLFRRKQRISWCAGTSYLVPDTFFLISIFRPRKRRTIITQQDQHQALAARLVQQQRQQRQSSSSCSSSTAEAEDAEDAESTRENVCVLYSSSTYTSYVQKQYAYLIRSSMYFGCCTSDLRHAAEGSDYTGHVPPSHSYQVRQPRYLPQTFYVPPSVERA